MKDEKKDGLQVVNSTIPALIEELEERSQKALAGLKSIGDITDDETLAKANRILVKVRRTFEDFQRRFSKPVLI